MGGSVTTGSQQQNSVQATTPWGPSGGIITGLLGNLSAINPGLTGNEASALDRLNALGAAGNPFASGIGNVANTLLTGGGPDRTSIVDDAYANYQKTLAPYLSSSYLDPRNTPGFGEALSALNSDITNQVNGQFAAAGRDLSGANSQALARGLSQGEGALIANQYNQNAARQLQAAQSVEGAGQSTAGLLSDLDQKRVANMQAGIGAADAANSAATYGPLLQLQAAAQARGIPLQALAQEMGITLGPASTFGTQTGNSTTTHQSPLWQQIAGGVIGGAGLFGGMGAFGKNGWLNLGRIRET